MNNTVVDGIVERWAILPVDNSFSVLLVGDNTVYSFSSIYNAYSYDMVEPYGTSPTLVGFMMPGDHISFEIAGKRNSNLIWRDAIRESLRNWTLENRLIGNEIDSTTQSELLNDMSIKLA